LPMTLNVELPDIRSLFGPGSALLDKDLHKALEGADPLVTAAETITQQSQLALLDAAQEPETIPFLENEVKPDDLDGEIWESQVFDETADQSDDDSQGRGLPPWRAPLTGDFAATIRGMDERDGASDDVALSDVDPENVAASSIWFGKEGDEIPPRLASMLDTDWERCSAFSRSTGASFYKVGDKDFDLPPVEDEEMPAADAAPAAASSDAALP